MEHIPSLVLLNGVWGAWSIAKVHGLTRRVQHSPSVVLLNGVWSFEQGATLSFVSFKCSLRSAESHCRTMSTVTDDESHTMTSFMFVLERFLRASWASGPSLHCEQNSF